MALREQIEAARGVRPADLVLKHARVVDVFTNEILATDVAVRDGKIVGLGSYGGPNELDLDGAYLTPGLIDGHIHLESTMLSPGEFARAVVPRGTTSVVVDPHEIANVLGADGIRWLVEATANLPVTVYVNLPSCVPASAMESSAYSLEADDLQPLFDLDRVVGIAEMMNFPGVLSGEISVLSKIELGQRLKVPIDGHCPGLSGKDLNAYFAAGIESDHEATRPEEAEEKLRLGAWLMLREGSIEHNLEDLLPVVIRLRARRVMFASDDRTAPDLRDEGHVDHAIRLAIRRDLDPIWAIAMATINPAERFGLRRLGAVAPGYAADLVVVEDLRDFQATLVFKKGVVVARNGVAAFASSPSVDAAVVNTMRVGHLDESSFRIHDRGVACRVIQLVPRQIVTKQSIERPTVARGDVVADPSRDLLKLAVVERHRASGRVGIGLVSGFGLKQGALGSSVAHDAHNVCVVGTNDADMKRAVEAISELQGGLVVVVDGQIRAALPLPIAGLMSDLPFEEVAGRLELVEKAAADLGCTASHPFMALSFLALSVVPSLKLTDLGLVDVDSWKIVPVYAEST